MVLIRLLPLYTKSLAIVSVLAVGLCCFFAVQANNINCQGCNDDCNKCQCDLTTNSTTNSTGIFPNNYECKLCCNNCPCSEGMRYVYIGLAVISGSGSFVSIVYTVAYGCHWIEHKEYIDKINFNKLKDKDKLKEQEEKIKELRIQLKRNEEEKLNNLNNNYNVIIQEGGEPDY